MFRARKSKLIVAAILAAFFMAGCSGLQTPEEELTPLEKAKKTATWINDTYTAQWDDYQATVNLPNLTEAQKKVLRAKYKILTEVDPLRKAFNQAIDDNLVPSPELEQQIMKLLTRLQTMTTQPEGG